MAIKNIKIIKKEGSGETSPDTKLYMFYMFFMAKNRKELK